MIRRGKAEGWLSLPSKALQPWMSLNGIELYGIKPGTVAGKGSGLFASKHIESDVMRPGLMKVSWDMVLNLKRVVEHAKVDKDFREVYESLGEFGTKPRGAILTFLLFQASMVCPSLSERVGVHGPFVDYVKSLPMEFLPTFWTPKELELLQGTTLLPATTAKMRSLQREWDSLCESVAHTRWYRLVQEFIDFDDWLQVDAMYRSRALEFPGIGHCMVPCLDLANHASHNDTAAFYDKDSEGNAFLLPRSSMKLEEGDEVTITYGDDKGACEMLHSYGFLDPSMSNAGAIFLDLTFPSDDPQRDAKIQFFTDFGHCPPGVKISNKSSILEAWDSDFPYLLSATAEDGLRFELARTVDGNEEMRGFLGETEIMTGAVGDADEGTSLGLIAAMEESEMWDVYNLRATVIVQDRVAYQMLQLHRSDVDAEDVEHGEGTEVRTRPWELAKQLRRLELRLLRKVYQILEERKTQFCASGVVQKYLKDMNGDYSDSDETMEDNARTAEMEDDADATEVEGEVEDIVFKGEDEEDFS